MTTDARTKPLRDPPAPAAPSVRPLTAKEAWELAGVLGAAADGAESEGTRQRVWAALGLGDDASVDELVEALKRLLDEV